MVVNLQQRPTRLGFEVINKALFIRSLLREIANFTVYSLAMAQSLVDRLADNFKVVQKANAF